MVAKTPGVTKVGFVLEVSAESEEDLKDKLYGYDDVEAEAIARGFWPREVSHEQMKEMDPIPETQINSVQERQETVNELLRNASFDGHNVVFMTDGTNLDTDRVEVPHFDYPSGSANDPLDDETVYRMFPRADLILSGKADNDIIANYMLREDVHISLSTLQTATLDQ